MLVLNTTRDQDAAIQERLAASGVAPEDRMQIIEYDTPSEIRCRIFYHSMFFLGIDTSYLLPRNAMYRKSGIFSVTSRILAVDMLLKRVPVAMISGIVIYNAHRYLFASSPLAQK